MHIILDMDGTLIDSDKNQEIYIRPYLIYFLDFCFRYFETVSIWTGANKSWFKKVDDAVLQPLINIINKVRGTNYSFYFVKTYKDCIWNYSAGEYYKMLKEVFGHNGYPHKKCNTFIVDDVAATYKYNKKNGIHIDHYRFDTEDRELIRVMREFSVMFD